ncbi:unnamed protein product [Owenia fusiformis]|uniref:Sulfotransferase domain-containing protein n=1 Tax=Owenia fusiformis TaxID=6347 RepID=A0A8S4Q9D6_OWEFU|nr:unnamed protein product [Owenia fusiformis]
MRLVSFLLYSIVRNIFITLQRIYWKITGISSFLHEINDGKHYNKSAQVGTIRLREKIVEFNLSQEADFLFTHDKFADPRCVLDNDVTLYTITDNNEALFVETPSDINIYSSDVHPFFYVAQFNHAVRVIKMPFGSFTKIANEIGDPRMQVVLISSTGRCGSTLLTQIFETTGKFVTIAEPDAMTKLALLRETIEKRMWKQMYKNLVRFLCKPRYDVQLQPAYCIKTRNVCANDIDFIANAFPNINLIFLYRDGLNTVKSMYNITGSFNEIQQYFLPNTISNMMMNSLAPHWTKGKTFKKSPLSYLTLEWGIVMLIYIRHHQNGVKMAAIRYEDLLDNPTQSCAAIFKYCDISAEFVSRGVRAMKKMSQRGSYMGTDRARREITEHMKAEPNDLLTNMALPRLGEPSIVPGLITLNNNCQS